MLLWVLLTGDFLVGLVVEVFSTTAPALEDAGITLPVVVGPGVVVRVGRKPDVLLASLEELIIGRGGELVGILLTEWAIVALTGDGDLTVLEYQFNTTSKQTSSFSRHDSYYA